MCLLQLPALLNGDPEAEFRPSPFFAEQLTAFELWLAHGSAMKQPPEQLPIVLQACPFPVCPARTELFSQGCSRPINMMQPQYICWGPFFMCTSIPGASRCSKTG